MMIIVGKKDLPLPPIAEAERLVNLLPTVKSPLWRDEPVMCPAVEVEWTWPPSSGQDSLNCKNQSQKTTRKDWVHHPKTTITTNRLRLSLSPRNKQQCNQKPHKVLLTEEALAVLVQSRGKEEGLKE
jgi:hypothetical protein